MDPSHPRNVERFRTQMVVGAMVVALYGLLELIVWLKSFFA